MDLKEAFNAAGHFAVVCATAAAARRELAAGRYGLVVLDVLLPDMDGIELLKDLRREARTAASRSLSCPRGPGAGPDRRSGPGPLEYAGKPYDRSHLIMRAQQLLERAGSGGADRKPPRVLVIDDSSTYRQELGERLRDAGYDVLLAETGEQGLRLAVEERPDAAVVDGVLPDIPVRRWSRASSPRPGCGTFPACC